MLRYILFYINDEEYIMKNNILYYSVGALLYCPADHPDIASAIIHEKFDTPYSLALCLEDTIRDHMVQKAEEALIRTLFKIAQAKNDTSFYMPNIFIRVRSPEQILRLTRALGTSAFVVIGFIIPKFSTDSAKHYIDAVYSANEHTKTTLYMMPIYEHSSLLDPRRRIDELHSLKECMTPAEELIMTIRVGGNDLCHTLGLRRHRDESIHQIRPIADIFSDIVSVYGTDYVISAPVWEYYAGEGWADGLRRELREDRLCGFIGKTAIHPNQISIINDAFRVSSEDLHDARAILNWDTQKHPLVAGSARSERMNEYKTHTNWAHRTIFLSQVFGVADH